MDVHAVGNMYRCRYAHATWLGAARAVVCRGNRYRYRHRHRLPDQQDATKRPKFLGTTGEAFRRQGAGLVKEELDGMLEAGHWERPREYDHVLEW